MHVMQSWSETDGWREMARFFLGSSNNLKHTVVLVTIISISIISISIISIISIIFIIRISINLSRTVLLTKIPIGLPAHAPGRH